MMMLWLALAVVDYIRSGTRPVFKFIYTYIHVLTYVTTLHEYTYLSMDRDETRDRILTYYKHHAVRSASWSPMQCKSHKSSITITMYVVTTRDNNIVTEQNQPSWIPKRRNTKFLTVVLVGLVDLPIAYRTVNQPNVLYHGNDTTYLRPYPNTRAVAEMRLDRIGIYIAGLTLDMSCIPVL